MLTAAEEVGENLKPNTCNKVVEWAKASLRSRLAKKLATKAIHNPEARGVLAAKYVNAISVEGRGWRGYVLPAVYE
jgi:hypothetical protein